MRNSKLFLLLALASGYTAVSAQNVLSVSVSKNGTGTRTYADIVLDVETSINGISFDLAYPSSLTYSNAAIAKEGIFQVYSEDDDEYFNIWTLSGMTNFADGGFVRLVAMTTEEGNELKSGDIGKTIRVTFKSSADDTYSITDFTFNNFSCTLGEDRVELKAPIAILGAGGYSTYSTTQDVVVENATANYGVIDSDVVKLEPVTDAIYHGNGVVLKGEKQGDVVYGTSVTSATKPSQNDLIPTLNGSEVSNVLVLSTKDAITGFYKYSGSYIRACKAYIEGTAPLRIVTDTTGIENVDSEQNVEAIFNLQGQKQQEIKSGINIVNGKKVMY